MIDSCSEEPRTNGWLNTIDLDLIKSTFGDIAAVATRAISSQASGFTQFSYPLSQHEEFAELCSRQWTSMEENRRYWFEIVYRSHLSAVTSILRYLQWVSACSNSIRMNNFVSFAAAFRGMLESTADATDALLKVPLLLAEKSSYINAIVNERAEKAIKMNEIHEILLHYQYASKNRSAIHAKAIRDYLESLGKIWPSRLLDCYGYLCDVTHPGYSSVHAFLEQDVADGSYRLSMNRDKTLISDFAGEYADVLPLLFEGGMNPSSLILKAINRLPFESLFVKEVEQINFENISLWQRMKPHLE